VAKSTYEALFPDHDQGRDVFFQGSRQMDSLSRRYYEKELGAGMGPSPAFDEAFGYTEPWRRMVQREDFSPQAQGETSFFPFCHLRKQLPQGSHMPCYVHVG
jgi:hypothetical protein